MNCGFIMCSSVFNEKRKSVITVGIKGAEGILGVCCNNTTLLYLFNAFHAIQEPVGDRVQLQ